MIADDDDDQYGNADDDDDQYDDDNVTSNSRSPARPSRQDCAAEDTSSPRRK